MMELLTAAQMREIEQDAIAAGVVTGLELMERAGRGVVEAVFEEWPDLAKSPQRAVVLCGPGNNGGDGFVVARLLRQLGWEVDVFLFGDPAKLPPDAKTNHDRWCEMGLVHPPDTLRTPMAFPDILVDAVLGTGLTRPVEGQLAQVLGTFDAFRDERGIRKVAVDVPSGLCADSGKTLGTVATADLTVSFHAAKLGHYLARGAHQCGKLVVKSIGLDTRPVADGVVSLVEAPQNRTLDKSVASHKFGHGHALILCGGAGRTGAARLAARGALRIGAGLVTLGVPGAAQQEVACQITALMLRRVDDAEALAGVLSDARFNALCLGPGLGVARARALVPAALESARATVLDADALTAYAEEPASLFALLHRNCVLTPHAGEFRRIFPDLAENLAIPATTGPACSKVDATREAARRAGCVVLFKGADTVIAAPDGRCAIHAAMYGRAAPWLATAGAGDVLAGFITGLMARGVDAFEAARSAAWLHVECARAFGPGLIAEDLPEEVPGVLRAAGL